MNRPDWDTYFLNIAKEVATRSTCPRASVGAVIVRDKRILATGYNGAAPAEEHCTEAGCLMQDGHCQRAIHAETNAIAQGAKFGVPVDNSTMYFWDSQGRPASSCIKCSQIMSTAGISRIVGRE